MMEMNDPMNAHIVPKERADQLGKFQKKLIVKIAMSKDDPYPKRAERLRKLSFCTDECKFEVLSQSAYISKELYDCLSDIYFGRVQPAGEIFEPKPLDIARAQNEKRVSETIADQADSLVPEADASTETPPENTEAASDTEQAEPAAVKRNHTKRMTEEDTIELIKLYLSGMKCPKLASRFGRTVAQIRQKIAGCKRSPKYKEMFEMNSTDKNTEERFDEIISSVDAGQRHTAYQTKRLHYVRNGYPIQG